MSDPLAFAGLLLTLIGASLLFFYGLPRKKLENVIVGANHVEVLEPIGSERNVPESEWGPFARGFQKRARTLNRTGFALVAVGTLLQMAAVCV
jgi:hypothetical protein